MALALCPLPRKRKFSRRRLVLVSQFEEWFWKRVDKHSSPNGCWLWTDQLDGNGYGAVKRHLAKRFGHSRRAHIVAWNLTKRKRVPKGKMLCHNCPGGDNRACVNPDHCFVGTAKDNGEDMKRKGRSTFGEKNGRALLTEKLVLRMRRRYAKGDVTVVDVARIFHVHRSHAHLVEVASQDATTLANFKNSLANTTYLGMTAGGGCFYGHGVNKRGGSATFQVLDIHKF